MTTVTNIVAAGWAVTRELRTLARTIALCEREDFFDPRNRDVWIDAFIEHLQKKYQKRDRIASND